MSLGTATQNNITIGTFGKSFVALHPDQQAAATTIMRSLLQGVDLSSCDSETMSLHHVEIAKIVTTGSHAVLFGRSGWMECNLGSS